MAPSIETQAWPRQAFSQASSIHSVVPKPSAKPPIHTTANSHGRRDSHRLGGCAQATAALRVFCMTVAKNRRNQRRAQPISATHARREPVLGHGVAAPVSVLLRLVGVARHLHADDAVGIGDRAVAGGVALLDRVDRLYSRNHLAEDG